MALPVTSGLILDLAASSLSLSDGDAVTSWADSSSAGNNTTITGMTPVYKTAVTPTGSPSVRFSVNGAFLPPNNSLFDAASSATVFAVVRSDGTSDNPGFYQFGGNDWTYYTYEGNLYDGSFTNSRYGPISTATPTDFHVYCVYHDGTNRVTLIDNVQVHSVAVGFTPPSSAAKYQMRIGSTHLDTIPWRGDIVEFAAYNRALNSTERAQVYDYLASTHIGDSSQLAGQISLALNFSAELSVEAPFAGSISLPLDFTADLTVSYPASIELAGSISSGLSFAAGFSLSQELAGSISSGLSFATADLYTRYSQVENSAVQVVLYDHTGLVQVAVLETARNAQWQDATPGAGSFEVSLDDPKLSLIEENSIVKFKLWGRARFGVRIKTESVSLAEDGSRWVKFENQPGLMSLLADALVYPEFGVQAPLYKIPTRSAKTRTFGFMNGTGGGWYKDSQWVHPTGVRWTQILGSRNNFPENLRVIDKYAQFIAVGGPYLNRPVGSTQYFRRYFTLPSDMNVQIYATGDNNVEVWLDSQLIISPKKDEPLQWMVAQMKGLSLAKGPHLIAAKVVNASENVTRRSSTDSTLVHTPARPSPLAFIGTVVYLSQVTGKPGDVTAGATLDADVAFNYDSATLTAPAIIELNEIISRLNGSAPKIYVEGHASTDGNAGYNMTLSQNRANAVKAYILSKRSSAVITAVGKGETDPKYTPGTDARNRRVEITYPAAEPGVEEGDIWAAKVITRSDSSWLASTAEQGWYRGQVLRKLVKEAQARGCLGPSVLKIGFGETVGSDKQPWTNPGQFTFDIGSKNLLEVAQQLGEAYFDPWVDAETMELRGANRRGKRRVSGPQAVRLFVGNNVTQADVSTSNNRVTDVIYQKADGTWDEYRDSSNFASVGRIEVGLALGTTDDANTAVKLANTLVRQSFPSIVFAGQTSAQLGPQPYLDYNRGDTILVPGPRGVGTVPARVLAITVDASNDPIVVYPELAYDPIQTEPPRRLPLTDEEKRKSAVDSATSPGAKMTSFASPVIEKDDQSTTSGVQVYVQSEEPSHAGVGDLWVDDTVGDN